MTTARATRNYELGVNACVVKPIKFQSFVEAVRQPGMFWMMVDEPPPAAMPRPEPCG